MPIKRWHGWGAVCKRCGKWVDISGEGHTAWESRDDVKDALRDVNPCAETIEEQIHELCGCP